MTQFPTREVTLSVDLESSFQGPIQVEVVGRDKWKLIKDVRYRSIIAGQIFEVPAGFVFDGASVPRAPFTFWAAGGRAFPASIIHDFLYRAPWWTDRPLADKIFYEITRCSQPEYGIEPEPLLIAWAMYDALVIFGEVAWKSHGKPGDPAPPVVERGSGESE